MEVSKVLIASILVVSLSLVALSAPVKRSSSEIEVLADVVSRQVKNATQEVWIENVLYFWVDNLGNKNRFDGYAISWGFLSQFSVLKLKLSNSFMKFFLDSKRKKHLTQKNNLKVTHSHLNLALPKTLINSFSGIFLLNFQLIQMWRLAFQVVDVQFL